METGSKTVELYTSTSDDKEAWIDALFAAMTELTRRKSSLRTSPVQQTSPTSSGANGHTSSHPLQQPAPSNSIASVAQLDRDSLGKTPPTLVRMDLVSRCSICQSQFTVMRRKHHCHSCGQVMCNRCSSNKLTLAYDMGKALRVCDNCHQTLMSKASSTSPRCAESSTASEAGSPDSSPVAEANPSPSNHRTGLLEVKVETASVLSGYLLLKTRGKTWHKRWFALRSDFVLYSYRSHHGESRAMTATPVPGFTVSVVSGSTAPVSGSSYPSGLVDGASPSHKPCAAVASSSSSTSGAEGSTERDRSFKMAHVHKSYLFQAATRQEAERFVPTTPPSTSYFLAALCNNQFIGSIAFIAGGSSFSRWPPEPIFRLQLDAKQSIHYSNEERKNQRCCTYLLLSHLFFCFVIGRKSRKSSS